MFISLGVPVTARLYTPECFFKRIDAKHEKIIMPIFIEGGRGSRGNFFHVVHSPDAVKVFHEPPTIMQKQILNNSPRQKTALESMKKAYLRQKGTNFLNHQPMERAPKYINKSVLKQHFKGN